MLNPLVLVVFVTLSGSVFAQTVGTESGQDGRCGWYTRPEGSPTASGAPFNSSAMTAAHKYLPFGTAVHVVAGLFKNVVIINDRPELDREEILLVTQEGRIKLGIWSQERLCELSW